MRKTSERRGRQSLRKARKMRFSPFWLKMRMPESMLEGDRASPLAGVYLDSRTVSLQTLIEDWEPASVGPC